MSSSIKSFNFDYMNKQKKDLFSDDEDNDFNFKYVPANQFKHIVKNVQRQRTKLDEQRIWNSFVQQQDIEQSDYHVNYSHIEQSIKLQVQDDWNFDDPQLQRLENDVFSQETNGLEGSKTVRLEKSHINLKYSININQTPTPPSPCYEMDEYDQDDLYLKLPPENEEICNPSTFERSPVSKLDLKSKSTSSRYNPTPGRESDRSVFRQLNRPRYNTSPELSSHDNIDDYDLSQLRPRPAVAQKILLIQKKISECLNEIDSKLSHIPQPDGEIELKRRQQSVVEFSIRFSRNYLYDLGRQMAEIQKRVQAISPKSHGPETKRRIIMHMQTLERKLCSTHQLLLNALSAYCKHIPTSILKGHPGKLKEILQVVINLKNVCLKINLTAEDSGAGDTAPPLGSDTERRCSAILSKVRLNSDKESQRQNQSTQSSSTRISSVGRKKSANRQDKRQIVPNRLSMYTMDARVNKIPKHRRPVGLHPKNRSASAGKLALKNPPPTPEQLLSTQSSSKITKDTVKRSRRRVQCYQNEDDIKTMMDIMPVASETRKNIDPELLTMETLAALKEYLLNKNEDTTPASDDERASDRTNGKIPDDQSVNVELTSCDQKNQVLSSHTEKSSETSPVQLRQQIKMKNERPIELRVSEEATKRLLDYRDEYESSCSINPMYASVSANKPWEVVTWIADKLVDELIVDVSKELQMDDVIKKLFEMEFQEY